MWKFLVCGVQPHAWALIGSGGSESPAVIQPSAGQGSAQNSPVLHVILPVNLEGQRCGPAWQEERVPATYNATWTGVPQRPEEETEGIEVVDERRRKEVEKVRVYFGLLFMFFKHL